jgi:uncharacterized membrane protein YidH (DUF202 family)
MLMHEPAASAISVLLLGLTAFFVFAAALQWAKLAHHPERADERPTIPIHSFRAAAGLTAVALVMLGLALLWSALLAFPK